MSAKPTLSRSLIVRKTLERLHIAVGRVSTEFSENRERFLTTVHTTDPDSVMEAAPLIPLCVIEAAALDASRVLLTIERRLPL